MNTKDTFFTILSFLQPKELSKLLLLTHLHRQWTLQWLSYEKGCKNTHDLEESVCPICCCWKSDQNLEDYHEFFDTPSYVSHLIRQKVESFLPKLNTRYSLFCLDCEYEEYYVNKMEEFTLPFRGKRKYYIYQIHSEINNSYAIIYKKCNRNHDNIWQWNQIRMVIPSSSIQYTEW